MSDVEMVGRHIRLGEKTLARQRAIVAQLVKLGQPTGEAERLLVLFEGLQALHEAQLARLIVGRST